MAEISKDSKFTLSVESLVVLGGVIVTTVGMWFTLQAEIEEAKKLPPSEVSRTEYDLKAVSYTHLTLPTKRIV